MLFQQAALQSLPATGASWAMRRQKRWEKKKRKMKEEGDDWSAPSRGKNASMSEERNGGSVLKRLILPRVCFCKNVKYKLNIWNVWKVAANKPHSDYPTTYLWSVLYDKNLKGKGLLLCEKYKSIFKEICEKRLCVISKKKRKKETHVKCKEVMLILALCGRWIRGVNDAEPHTGPSLSLSSLSPHLTLFIVPLFLCTS